MATPKMVSMGIKRKEMYPAGASEPKSEKEYEKEEVRPELHLSGPHAEMMGAEDLKKGDRIRQTVEWVVKERTKREVDGKPTEYELTLCIDKAGDHEECDEGDGDADEAEPGETEASPAMAYLQRNAG